MANTSNQGAVGASGAMLAVVGATLLAITNIMAPIIYDAGSNPPTVLMLRAITTAVVLALVLFYQKRLHFLARGDELRCLISGIMFMFAGVGLLTAFSLIPVSIAVLVLYLFPLLTTLFDSIARRQMPSMVTVGLMLVALFGLGLALDSGEQELNISGILLALMAAISVAITFVWNNHKLSHVNSEQITMRIFCVNFVVFAVYVYLSGSFALPQSDQTLLLVIMLACFAVAFLSVFRAAQMAGSVRVAMIMNLEPIVSIVLSVIILAEAVNLLQGIGAAFVLVAVLISQIIEKRWQAVEKQA